MVQSCHDGGADHFDNSDQNGSYLVNSKVANEEAEPYALDKINAEKLWRLSEEIVGQKFEYWAYSKTVC